MAHQLYIIMGVAGSGKTSIGEAAAKVLDGTYMDGDDLHSKSNIDKMASGQPLNDDDRWPWLQAIAQQISSHNGLMIVGCSALKKIYRDFILKQVGKPVQFIYLNGSKELIAERMASRKGHFMPTDLLDSQFCTLEVPSGEEPYIDIDISKTPAQVVNDVVAAIQAQNRN